MFGRRCQTRIESKVLLSDMTRLLIYGVSDCINIWWKSGITFIFILIACLHRRENHSLVCRHIKICCIQVAKVYMPNSLF